MEGLITIINGIKW